MENEAQAKEIEMNGNGHKKTHVERVRKEMKKKKKRCTRIKRINKRLFVCFSFRNLN